MEFANLTNQFLIAMPSLADPNFERTVTFICAHNDDGAMGIVINRPLELNLGEVFQHMDIHSDSDSINHRPVYSGGPVQRERGFVIHHPTGDWDAVLPVSDEVAVATSRDILAAMAEGEGPDKSLVALGYAGWGAGQLEREMIENAWLNGPMDSAIIFDLPHQERWSAAASHMGVDLVQLSGEAGHA